MKGLLEAPDIKRNEPARLGFTLKESKPRNTALIVGVIVAIALVAAGIIRRVGRTSSAVPKETASTIVVKRADLVRSLRLTGALEAVNFLAIAGLLLRDCLALAVVDHATGELLERNRVVIADSIH